MPHDSLDDIYVWRHALSLTQPALLAAPRNVLNETRQRCTEAGVAAAVAALDTILLFDWIVNLLARQGISNHAAITFAEQNGSPTFDAITARISEARCPRLRSYWHYAGCGYRRAVGTCNVPHHQVGCPVTLIPARKGVLAEAAIGLWLFVRDVCDGDFVGWIDHRLAGADGGCSPRDRTRRMRAALLEPLVEIPGTGEKVWSMILAELLLAGDPRRERWVATGASFVAIDSLVHGFLTRTGILRRLGCEHPYGPACTAPGGCRDTIQLLADRIDARAFDPTYPRCFPRWVQFAIWLFCAEGGWNVCNGRQIDDRERCRQRYCPAYGVCDRVPLSGVAADASQPA